MQFIKLHEISFYIDETFVTAALSNANELVMLMNSGSVIKYDIAEQKREILFSVKSSITYADGGFNITAASTLYTLDKIVVLVNDYKTHGFVHYPENYTLHLYREDYYADISCYPIALFKNALGVPHIIYAEAWNHLQIMNLDTRQVLTADKSLIEENAEEEHIKFYKKHDEANKLAWPRRYDYFFGKLLLSPYSTKFLSAGWGWGSCDFYKVYDINHFITSKRISDIDAFGGEHEGRAACWIDDNTIAIAYHPFTEGDEDVNDKSFYEIRLYKIAADKAGIIKKIIIKDIDIVHPHMKYNEKQNFIVVFSASVGLAIISLTGDVLYHNSNLDITDYDPKTNLFLKTEAAKVCVYELR